MSAEVDPAWFAIVGPLRALIYERNAWRDRALRLEQAPEQKTVAQLLATPEFHSGAYYIVFANEFGNPVKLCVDPEWGSIGALDGDEIEGVDWEPMLRELASIGTLVRRDA